MYTSVKQTLLGFDLFLQKVKGTSYKENGKVMKNTIRFYQSCFISKYNKTPLNSLAVSKINAQAEIDKTHVQLQKRAGGERRMADGMRGGGEIEANKRRKV